MKKIFSISSIVLSIISAETINNSAVQNLDIFNQKQMQDYIDLELNEAQKKQDLDKNEQLLDSEKKPNIFLKKFLLGMAN